MLPDRSPRPINDTPSYATESILLPRPPAHTRHVHVLHGRIPRVPGGADPTEGWPLSQREMIELRTQSLSLCQRRRQRSVDWSGGRRGGNRMGNQRERPPPTSHCSSKECGKTRRNSLNDEIQSLPPNSSLNALRFPGICPLSPPAPPVPLAPLETIKTAVPPPKSHSEISCPCRTHTEPTEPAFN